VSALDSLANERRWVGWRNEQRGDRSTKVPYGAGDRPAKADNPSTWVTRDEAAELAKRIANGHGGGIGLELGNIGNDLHMIGIDLDSCIEAVDGQRRIAGWAREIIEAASTYSEISPSGTGIKLFAYAISNNVRPFLDAIGVPAEGWGCRRSVPGYDGSNHGPAIEIYCAGRYFAVTDKPLGSSPDRLEVLDWATLLRLAEHVPPPRTNGAGPRGGATGDNSRSAKAFREGDRLRREGKTFAEMCEALDSDPETAAWVREKGMPNGMRELHRIWKRAAPASGHSDGVSLDDFYAFMPMHNYIFTPTRTTWPGASVNSRIPPIKLTDDKGAPVLDKDGKQVVLAAGAWLDRFKPVEQMTWAPGLPMVISEKLIIEGGWIERAGVACFNLYHPPTIIPGIATKAGKWLEHVNYVFPAETDHILDWLAHRVQRPQDKINHALVLGGAQGIGKDTLLEPVKYAIGPWNFQEVSPAQILGRFNGFLKSVILRVNEARDLGEYDRFQLYDHMKAYTAAPPDVLRVDEKHLREYSITNCCGVIITTNHKTDGIFLPADDRRHYVAWSDRIKEDPKFQGCYWNSLWTDYAEDGINHVAAFLLERDISGFNAKAPPPKTAAFWAIVDANRAPEESELADALDRIGNPDAVTLAMIQNAATDTFADWLGDRRNRRIIPHRLEKCGYVSVRNPSDTSDGHWKIRGRRQAVYAKTTLSLRAQITAAEKLRSVLSVKSVKTYYHIILPPGLMG
jgi:hypothetical protein